MILKAVDVEGSGNGIVSVDRPVASFAEAKYRALKVYAFNMEKRRGIRERNSPFWGRYPEGSVTNFAGKFLSRPGAIARFIT